MKEKDAYYHLKELMEILAEPLEHYLIGKEIEKKEIEGKEKEEERKEPITIVGGFEKKDSERR